MESKIPSKCDIKHRMSELLFEESLSDIVFLVDEPPHRFSCHRLILATGSEVFAAMLYGKMAEKSEISVPDITATGFSNMLRYLYTDVVTFENESDAIETAYASKKYLIKNLFQTCEDYLLSKADVNMNSVFSLYEEAAFLEMIRLQSRCLRYVSRHAHKIFCSKSFVAASVTTLQEILKMDSMHVESEQEIIEAIWTWGDERCKEMGIECTGENIRKLTKDLLKHVRFLSLGTEELENVFQKFHFLDESEQLAVLWNTAMPSRVGSVRMPSNLSEVSRRRSISSSSRIELPTEYRYNGNMTNFSVKKHSQRVDLTATGPGVTIVGVVVAFKAVACYSMLHRQLDIELFACNQTTNCQTSVKSSRTASEQTDDKQLEEEILLDDYIVFSGGDVGYLTVRMEGEGVRIMECMKEEFSREITGTIVTFNFNKDNNTNNLLFPIKEIMCIPDRKQT